jgi:hypothetical protein
MLINYPFAKCIVKNMSLLTNQYANSPFDIMKLGVDMRRGERVKYG